MLLHPSSGESQRVEAMSLAIDRIFGVMRRERDDATWLELLEITVRLSLTVEAIVLSEMNLLQYAARYN